MGDKVNTTIPVMFQKLNTYEAEDTRFLKVKIWLMHLGENFNGSYFDKSVVEDAINTLANTPILAYVEDNSSGDVDFSDHRMILVKQDGQLKIKYIGQAIGVIPETNEAQFETRLCDDGVEREFLTVEGLVWTKWDDPIDIFERDKSKSNSMELHDDYEGEWNKEDNLFHFTKFSFFGACALGSDVLPAMQNSTIEAQFSLDDLHMEINTKMEEFKRTFAKNTKEGGSESVDKKLELLQKYSLTEKDLESHKLSLEDYSLEELETKLQEITSIDNNFSLTSEQFRDELIAELSKEKIEDDWGWDYSRFGYVDYDESLVYVFDRSDSYKLYGLKYEVSGDSIKIDFESKSRKKIAFVDFEGEVGTDFSSISNEIIEYEVKAAEKKTEDKFSKDIQDSNDKYSKLEEEVNELRQFKSTKTQEERTESEASLFKQFSSELSEDEIKELKENASKYTLEQLEEKMYTLVGKKKVSFSKPTKKEKNPTVKVDIDNSVDEPKAYGGLFEKYSK